MTMQKYNAPPGSASTIGPQSMTSYHIKKALVTARQEQFFTQLADTKNMPKNFGKRMTIFEYIPLLDDRNLNDQGIDANGVTLVATEYSITLPQLVTSYAVEVNATNAAAAINAISAAAAVKAGAGPWTVTTTVLFLSPATSGQATTLLAAIAGATSKVNAGNLYGSSKDIGMITGKLPVLTENGGRVNRVGFTRVEREGTIAAFGFFHEFTQESHDFDSDPELWTHQAEELLKGAVEISEDLLQRDLLLAAGVIVYAGAAVSHATVTAEGGTPSIIDYAVLSRLSVTLDENRTPKQTKVISGSRNIDTRTISAGRVMFVGSEMLPLLEAMEDLFTNQAWVPVHKYGAAGQLLIGEEGSIGPFRVVVVPEMLHWAGQGAAVSVNPGYRATNGRYDVYPMMVVGSEAFSTIGFQTDGKSVKFKIITKMPGEETADRNDPYGKTGFSSIQWYYGTLVYRSERIAVVKTVAPM